MSGEDAEAASSDERLPESRRVRGERPCSFQHQGETLRGGSGRHTAAAEHQGGGNLHPYRPQAAVRVVLGRPDTKIAEKPGLRPEHVPGASPETRGNENQPDHAHPKVPAASWREIPRIPAPAAVCARSGVGDGSGGVVRGSAEAEEQAGDFVHGGGFRAFCRIEDRAQGVGVHGKEQEDDGSRTENCEIFYV